MMKIFVNIVAEVDEPNYPLGELSNLLYDLLDELATIEAKHRENVPFPLTKIKKSQFGKLTASIAKAD